MVGLFVQLKRVGDGKKVFVVHGRDEKARNGMFSFLSSLGLHPLEWSELKVSTGDPNPYIGDIIDRAFALAQAIVVLMTPDDEGRIREECVRDSDPESEKILTPQARLNVIFESGMAMGRCPERTIIVEWGKLRPFSDIAGRHVVRMDGTEGKWDELSSLLSMVGCVTEQKPDIRKGTGGLKVVATGTIPSASSTQGDRKRDLASEDEQESHPRRVFVRKAFSEIIGELGALTVVRIELLAKELYIGKWVEWEMVVSDVRQLGSGTTILALHETGSLGRVSVGGVMAHFSKERSGEITHLSIGEKVRVVGCISEVEKYWISLDPAELA